MINCAFGVIPAKAGIQKFLDRNSKTGFRVKPGMTIKEYKFFGCANIYDALFNELRKSNRTLRNLLRPPHPPLSPAYGGEDKGEGVNTMPMSVPLFMRKAIIIKISPKV